jgi:hypothetical protein
VLWLQVVMRQRAGLIELLWIGLLGCASNGDDGSTTGGTASTATGATVSTGSTGSATTSDASRTTSESDGDVTGNGTSETTAASTTGTPPSECIDACAVDEVCFTSACPGVIACVPASAPTCANTEPCEGGLICFDVTLAEGEGRCVTPEQLQPICNAQPAACWFSCGMG